jgi:membrane-associated phospholipid phosphatase
VVWRSVDVRFAGSLIESGYRYANNVAAVPSLHTAFATLVAVFMMPKRADWLRALPAIYPLAMAFALVYTGEHYVFDVVLGFVYAAGAFLAVATAARRRARNTRAAMAV